MALISKYERDDSRTVYRILADQALRCFGDPKSCAEERLPLTSLVRLLERYRYNAFSDNVALGILETLRAKNDPQAMDPRAMTRHMEGVINALETAHSRVYGSLSKDDLVQSLQSLLSRLASSAPLDQPDDGEKLDKARRFFLAFSEGLRSP